MPSDTFLNPYSFVSFGLQRNEPFEDGPAPSHDHAGEETVHGTIKVTVEAVNPLLVLDESTKVNSEVSDHFSYEIRKDAQGRILIPPTSMKGTMRSAYEAITNSRVGTPIGDMTRRLGYRKAARDAAKLIPVRVISGELNTKSLQLLRGHVKDQRADRATFSPAAFISADAIARAANADIRLLDAGDTGELKKYLALHGKEVRATLEPFSHFDGKGQLTFEGWRVKQFRFGDQDFQTSQMNGNAWRSLNSDRLQPFEVTGWLMLTGWKNARNKHEERLVFDTEIGTTKIIPLTDEIEGMWSDVMSSYLTAHDLRPGQEVSSARGSGLPSRTFYSAHLLDKSRRTLDVGRLLWVNLNNRDMVTEVHPVAIGRDLYKFPPVSLMPSHVLPPESLSEFSPADRLFGFVANAKTSDHEDHAWRGSITFSRVSEIRTPNSPKSIRKFDGGGKPLKILGAPKPQQGRFYTGRSIGKQASRFSGASKNAYSSANDQILRGRKMYWHHQKADWTKSDSTWSRPEKDGQNRSISEWIEPGTSFTFSLHVSNVIRTDLAALVWLLVKAMSDEAARLHLGYGAPLGFGSMKVNQLDVQIEDSVQLRERWMGLIPRANTDSASEIEEFCSLFEDSVKDKEGRLPRHILEYLRIRQGFDHSSIKYPRSSTEENGYEWFVENARRENPSTNGSPQVLPMALDDDPGLRPFAPPEHGANHGHRGGGGRPPRPNGGGRPPRGGNNPRRNR